MPKLFHISLTICTRKNDFFHCNNNQIMKKDKYSSCLYNLYDHKIKNIRNTCNIDFDVAKDHAVQVSGNTFRMLATNLTRLVINCDTPVVQHITGYHSFTLTPNCTEAYTPKYMFTYTNQYSAHAELLHLPLSSNISNWIPDVDVQFVADTIKQQVFFNKHAISYSVLVQKLQETHLQLFFLAKQYLHDVILLIILLYIFFRSIKIIFFVLKSCITCKKFNIAKCQTHNDKSIIKPRQSTGRYIHYSPAHLTERILNPPAIELVEPV